MGYITDSNARCQIEVFIILEEQLHVLRLNNSLHFHVKINMIPDIFNLNFTTSTCPNI